MMLVVADKGASCCKERKGKL